MDPAPEVIQAILHTQMIEMIGLLFCVLLTGIVLTLGVTSILLLYSQEDRNLLRRNRILCAYIILLFLLIFCFEAIAFAVDNSFTIFFSQPPNKTLEAVEKLGGVVGATSLASGLLCDAVFVWRCFMVQRALGPYKSSKWGSIFWVFPSCLWITTLVTGAMSVALQAHTSSGAHINIPGTIGVASNAALGVYAPVFLATRLLAHRKLATTPRGEKVWGMRHLPLVTILLQSAAINVPITIATAIGLGTGKVFSDVLGLLSSPSQALASVLIIHQVALGRAIDQQTKPDLVVSQNEAIVTTSKSSSHLC